MPACLPTVTKCPMSCLPAKCHKVSYILHVLVIHCHTVFQVLPGYPISWISAHYYHYYKVSQVSSVCPWSLEASCISCLSGHCFRCHMFHKFHLSANCLQEFPLLLTGLTLLHSERPKLHTILAFLGALWFNKERQQKYATDATAIADKVIHVSLSAS